MTEAGTAATVGSLLDSGTETPPPGAAAEITTVPLALSPAGHRGRSQRQQSAQAAVTVTNAELLVTPPLPSATCTVTVNTVSSPTGGGVNTADAPLPAMDPPSADQAYWSGSPSRSWACTVRVLVC